MGPVAHCGSRKCHESVKKVELELQLIGAALRSIADEMGAVLIRSAFSANIKERRDCSTALFDASGRMIAQAGRFELRNSHGSGMIRLDCNVSGWLLVRSVNVTVAPVTGSTSVNGVAFPALSCQV